MTEWIVDIQSMIPMGQIGERMLVAQTDKMAGTFALMHSSTLTSHRGCESFGENEVFMTSTAMGNAFGSNEIDQFLQAMMDAGWKRGLRPKNFDPSAGELAAVNRHLEDMRRVALARESITANVGHEAAAQLLRNDFDRTSIPDVVTEKKW